MIQWHLGSQELIHNNPMENVLKKISNTTLQFTCRMNLHTKRNHFQMLFILYCYWVTACVRVQNCTHNLAGLRAGIRIPYRMFSFYTRPCTDIEKQQHVLLHYRSPAKLLGICLTSISTVLMTTNRAVNLLYNMGNISSAVQNKYFCEIDHLI